LGFVARSRFHHSAFFDREFSATLTPYGLHCLESDIISAVRDFEVFTFKVVQMLAESPLPDACVANILMNAINMWSEPFEGGEPRKFRLIYSCYSGAGRFHKPDIPGTYWAIGHDRWMIEYDGRYKSVSEKVVVLIASTGRMTEVSVHDMFMVREGCEDELRYWPHPAAVNRFGRRLCNLEGEYVPAYPVVKE
jgi:hypothetical protein